MINLIPRIIRLWNKKVVCRNDPVAYARWLGVQVGDRCRFLTDVEAAFGSEPYLVSIGNHVSITGGVRFITHDGGVWIFREAMPSIDYFNRIVIEDNVFIGMNVTVMPGVRIGANSIIGVGSIVSRDVPANSVAVGMPARVVRSTDDYLATRQGAKICVRGVSAAEKRKIIEYHFQKDGKH